MKIAICDDSQVWLNKISLTLNNEFKKLGITISIDMYTNSNELLASKAEYDVFFLDIEMPEIDGFKLTEKLVEKNDNRLIVFVTSHEKCVFDALSYQPLNFLRKSNLSIEIVPLVKKLADIDIKNNATYLFKYRVTLVKVKINNIMYFESNAHQITISFAESIFVSDNNRKVNKIVIRDTIQNLLLQFEKYNFIRISSGVIVNLNYVFSIEKDCLVLDNGEKLTVSRSQRNNFKEKFSLEN